MKPSNIVADKLATWTFSRLIKGTGGEYPLQNLSISLQCDPKGVLHPDGNFKINVPSGESTDDYGLVPPALVEGIKIRREMESVSVKLGKDAEFLGRYYSHSLIAEDLAEAVERLTRLLVGLAKKDATAMHRLFGAALVSVIELEKLSFNEDSLRLLQAEACKQSLWPVPYSPHPRRKRELDKTMKKIRLGEQNYQKLWGARDTDKSPAGKFARRMGSALWIIYTAPGLKFYLSQQAIGMESKQREKYLLAQGWHLWMIRLCHLPELTKASVDAWFEVGWDALKEAAGGRFATVAELKKLGESNAAYGKTLGLKTGGQNSRAADQIKKLLRKAFHARFGNPS
jgi:hypothetical protein